MQFSLFLSSRLCQSGMKDKGRLNEARDSKIPGPKIAARAVYGPFIYGVVVKGNKSPGAELLNV